MNKGYYNNSNEMQGAGKRVVIIIICGLLLLLFMYFLTTRILSKEVTKRRKQEQVTESTIQYDKILAGESFTVDNEEYYVVYYDSTDTELASTISSYQADTKDIKLYSVDLSDGMNKKYRTDGDVDTSSIENLKVKNPTLIHFKSKEVVDVLTDQDEIKNYLTK
ncbi:MAG: hypothetical protein PUB03_05190 [bacterium]|nr:hypothetical protein [bacterium]